MTFTREKNPQVTNSSVPERESLDSYFKDILANQSLDVRERMKYEYVRLLSFRDFPETPGIFLTELAKAGFYYTGKQDTVTCFSCGQSHSDWKTLHSLLEIHRRVSPDCVFLNGIGPGVSELEKNAPNDNAAFVQSSAIETNDHITGRAANGACGGPGDVQNPSTPRLQDNANNFQQNTTANRCQEVRADIPNHSVNSTRNGMSGTGTNWSTRPSTNTGIVFEKPRHFQYSVLSVRISSYQGWPNYLSQSPQQMAEAGLFYTGFGDSVRCFYCGGSLKHWEPEDDPWTEHARWFPHCPFLYQCKGDQYIGSADPSIIQTENETTVGECGNTADHDKQSDILSKPAVLSVLDIGYSTEIVLRAVDSLHIATGNTDFSAEELLQSVMDIEESAGMMSSSGELMTEKNIQETAEEKQLDVLEPPEVSCPESQDNTPTMDKDLRESLIEENRQLKEQAVCKICMEEDISIVFLPCGHMVACATCAPAMTKCPICRLTIKGTVRAFLA